MPVVMQEQQYAKDDQQQAAENTAGARPSLRCSHCGIKGTGSHGCYCPCPAYGLGWFGGTTGGGFAAGRPCRAPGYSTWPSIGARAEVSRRMPVTMNTTG